MVAAQGGKARQPPSTVLTLGRVDPDRGGAHLPGSTDPVNYGATAVGSHPRTIVTQKLEFLEDRKGDREVHRSPSPRIEVGPVHIEVTQEDHTARRAGTFKLGQVYLDLFPESSPGNQAPGTVRPIDQTYKKGRRLPRHLCPQGAVSRL